MTDDIRWGLVIVAGVGVVLNLIMVSRLQADIREARRYALLDGDLAVALRARRRQSWALLIVAVCIAASAVFDPGTGIARLLIFIAACTVDWKSWKLFGDRFDADVMVSRQIRRDRERQRPYKED